MTDQAKANLTAINHFRYHLRYLPFQDGFKEYLRKTLDLFDKAFAYEFCWASQRTLGEKLRKSERQVIRYTKAARVMGLFAIIAETQEGMARRCAEHGIEKRLRIDWQLNLHTRSEHWIWQTGRPPVEREAELVENAIRLLSRASRQDDTVSSCPPVQKDDTVSSCHTPEQDDTGVTVQDDTGVIQTVIDSTEAAKVAALPSRPRLSELKTNPPPETGGGSTANSAEAEGGIIIPHLKKPLDAATVKSIQQKMKDYRFPPTPPDSRFIPQAERESAIPASAETEGGIITPLPEQASAVSASPVSDYYAAMTASLGDHDSGPLPDDEPDEEITFRVPPDPVYEAEREAARCESERERQQFLTKRRACCVLLTELTDKLRTVQDVKAGALERRVSAGYIAHKTEEISKLIGSKCGINIRVEKSNMKRAHYSDLLVDRLAELPPTVSAWHVLCGFRQIEGLESPCWAVAISDGVWPSFRDRVISESLTSKGL